MQRALLVARRARLLPNARAVAAPHGARGLTSSSAASDDGGVNAPASFSPDKMQKGECSVWGEDLASARAHHHTW